jgi:hypothetical protein
MQKENRMRTQKTTTIKIISLHFDNQSNEIFTDIDNYNNSYNDNNQSDDNSYTGWGNNIHKLL